MISNYNSWKRNFEYLKVNIMILNKKLIEYKTNLWSSVITQIFFLFSFYIIFMVLVTNFGDIIGWTAEDYFIFLLILDIFFCLGGIFFWKEDLFQIIKKGDLNQHILRPTNTFLSYINSNLNPAGLIMVIINFITLIGFFYFLKIGLIKFIISLLLGLVFAFEYILFTQFYQSFEFWFKNSSNYFREIFNSIHGVLQSYPYQLFSVSKIKYFILIIPTTYFSSIIMPYLKNESIPDLKLQIIIFIIVNIILIFTTIYNWKQGLKKYEAFG